MYTKAKICTDTMKKLEATCELLKVLHKPYHWECKMIESKTSECNNRNSWKRAKNPTPERHLRIICSATTVINKRVKSVHKQEYLTTFLHKPKNPKIIWKAEVTISAPCIPAIVCVNRWKIMQIANTKIRKTKKGYKASQKYYQNLWNSFHLSKIKANMGDIRLLNLVGIFYSLISLCLDDRSCGNHKCVWTTNYWWKSGAK